MKSLLIFVGSLCVGLGLLGIFIPLLPTTPFLLLAAACYAKSSDVFYQWLLNHKWLGPYIRDFRSEQSLSRAQRLKAIALLWVTMAVSFYFLRSHGVARVVLPVCGLAITIFLLTFKAAKR